MPHDGTIAFGVHVMVVNPSPDAIPDTGMHVELLCGGRDAFTMDALGEVAAEGSRRALAFRAVVPVTAIPVGIRPLWIRLRILGTPTILRLSPSAGVQRSGRRRETTGVWLQVRPGQGGLIISRQAAGGVPAQLLWHARGWISNGLDVARSRGRTRPRRDDIRPRHGFRAERLLRSLTMPMRWPGPIWLIGERTDTAQDNGRALFRYMRTAHRRRRVYYVIQRGVPNAANVTGLGHVVWYGSIRHRLLALHADALVGSHDMDRYLLPPSWVGQDYQSELAWRIGSKRIYLKHGVQVSAAPWLGLARKGYDMVISTGEREAGFIRSSNSYGHQVRITGHPRHDLLVPQLPSRVVVLMSTWRRYLVPPDGTTDAADPFLGSAYAAFFRDLLAHPRLHAALERHDYRLEFYPHHNMELLHRGFVPPDRRISVSSFRSREVKDALLECALFITDWSSVAFDAAYVGRAVIHAPFDEPEYRSRHYRDGWFEADADGFGPVERTVDGVIDRIEAYFAADCVREPIYAARADRFFAYRDQDNSRRVMDAIDALE